MDHEDKKEQKKLSEDILEDPLRLLGCPWKPSCMMFDPPSCIFARSEPCENEIEGFDAALNVHPEKMLLDFQEAIPPSDPVPTPVVKEPMPELESAPKRRGRKKPTPEQQTENRIQQLQRNRVSARESRKRKKQYIIGLEAEVCRLNHELLQFRTKLQNYELIEKQKNLQNLDSYRLMREYSQIGSQKKQVVPGHSESADCFVENLLSKYSKEAEERRRALDQLIKTELEILLSPPHKYILWASENHLGLFSPEVLNPALHQTHSQAETDDWEKIIEETKLSLEEATIVYSSKELFANSASRFRELVRTLLQTHKKLQEELKLIDTNIQKHFLKNIRIPMIRTYLEFIEKMSSRIELSNSNIFKYDLQCFSNESESDSGKESMEQEVFQ